MSVPVALHDDARADLREAMSWYDAQRVGLGDELLDGVDAVLQRISENPHQYPIVHRQVRRALMRRFPYAVFFVEQPGWIVVIAVLHGHRHPRTGKRRGA